MAAVWILIAKMQMRILMKNVSNSLFNLIY